MVADSVSIHDKDQPGILGDPQGLLAHCPDTEFEWRYAKDEVERLKAHITQLKSSAHKKEEMERKLSEVAVHNNFIRIVELKNSIHKVFDSLCNAPI